MSNLENCIIIVGDHLTNGTTASRGATGATPDV